ncbi:MAG: Uma2 family endonuclease [Armatimonadetes bacterium]|nr:Uma2 family endonuclease [Armatimonadota bacterium]
MTTIIDATSGITFEEFLRLEGHYEYINGNAVEMSPISDEHNRVTLFLLRILGDYTESRGCGEVRHDPYVMRRVAAEPGRAPDVMFVGSEHLDRIKPTHLEGPADLVVEVVSPESRVRDRGDKFYEYEQAGVREYWIIDSDRKRAEFYRLGGDGAYEPAQPTADGRYESAVIAGLWIRVGWLWDRPPVLSVLREWGIIA